LEDLKLFASRSVGKTDTSYLELPMLVIGKKRTFKKVDVDLKAKFKVIETSFNP